MDEKLLSELCNNLQNSLQDKSKTVKYFVGVKPTNLFFAFMHLGTTASMPTETPLSMFAEIWVDGSCVYRESISNRENTYTAKHKTEAIGKLLNSVFSFGVMAQCKHIEDAGYHGR